MVDMVDYAWYFLMAVRVNWRLTQTSLYKSGRYAPAIRYYNPFMTKDTQMDLSCDYWSQNGVIGVGRDRVAAARALPE